MTSAPTSAWRRERVVRRLAVHWPSGQVDRFADIQADRILTVREGQGLLPLTLARNFPANLFRLYVPRLAYPCPDPARL